MTEIVVKCAGALAAATVKGALTSGARGIPVQVALNEEWADLVPMLVAVCGDECREMVIDSTGKSVLPWECLIPGEKLRIGVRGLNRDGSVMIPTAWAACGVVRSSVNDADPEESSPAPSPALVEQINALAFKSSQEAQTAKETAEELVRRADAGEFDGAPGLAGQTGPQGETGPIGPQGEKGRDGVTPNIQIGTVRTVSSDTPAAVRRTGTDANPVLEFDIPKGINGQSVEVDAALEKAGAAADAAATGEVLLAIVNGFSEFGEYIDETLVDIVQEGQSLSKRVNENKRAINVLYKLNNGQTYDLETAEESGRNEAPSGAEYMYLAEIHGRTEQETTKGLQAIWQTNNNEETINGVTFRPLPDGGIMIFGTATARAEYYLHQEGMNYSIPAGTYYSSADAYIIFYCKSGYKVFNKRGIGMSLSDETVLSVYIRVEAGLTVDNTVYPMVSREKDAVFERYTGGIPTPNADSPEPIHSVESIHILHTNADGNTLGERTITPPRPLNAIGNYKDKADVDAGVWEWHSKIITAADYTHSVVREPEYFAAATVTAPIDASDLEWLRSLELVPATDRIAVTDQDGQDVPWLNEYIINLKEAAQNG